MKDVQERFENWLHRSRGPPPEARPRSRYQVVPILRPPHGVSFGWASYRALDPGESPRVELDLWMLRSTPTEVTDFDRLCGHLERVKCMCDRILEEVEAGGKSPKCRMILRGNLVSPSVGADPSLRVASESGLRVRLWTYCLQEGAFDVLPHIPGSSRLAEQKGGKLERLLKSLLINE